MAGPVRTYGFVNAKLRAKISKLLPDEHFRKMIRSRSFIEAIALLRGTEYGRIDAVYAQTGDLKMSELELQRRELEVLRGIERFVDGAVLGFVRALVTRYEVEELKNAVRLWFERLVRGRNVESKVAYLLREEVHYDIRWDEIVNAPTVEGLARCLSGTPYREIVEKTAPEVEARSSLFPLETALDRHFYEELLSRVDGLDTRDRGVAERLIGIEVDLSNVEWIVRYKRYYGMPVEDALERALPYGHAIDRGVLRESYLRSNPAESLGGVLRDRYPELAALFRSKQGDETANLAALESLLNELLVHEVHRVLGGYPFTIGVILAYFVLKQTEIRRIMTVLNAKYYDVEPERIGRLL